MKRLAAICLLCLLAFNWYGYRILMNTLEENASLALQQRLDSEQYDNSNLVEVKIPINLPYLSNWTDFEKYQGETEINGIHYKYVKRKLVNDTLVLLCIPNTEKTDLRTAQSDFFKQVNDFQSSSKKSSPSKDHSVKGPISDYLIKETLTGIYLIDEHVQHHSNYSCQLSFIFQLVKEHPPEC